MHAGRLAVAPVESAREDREFRALPYHLYRGDACWVPPLRSDEKRRWLPRHNASLRTRWVRRFLVRRAGHTVGRVAAIVDPQFAERWEPGAAFFGFFECTEDHEACRALLGAVEDSLRGRGVGRVLGPVNLTTNDEVGLLVQGFQFPPMILSPYHPAYYRALLEGVGFTPRIDYHAYAWTPAAETGPAVSRVVRFAARATVGAAVVVRPSVPRHWDAELRMLHELYNACFADLWGFVPVTWEELLERAEGFRPFYRPELALFAECGGRPVGFALALPDVNEALAHVGGRLWPLGWLRLLLRLRHTRAARFILLGVVPSFRGRGVAVLLAAAMAAAGRRLGIRRGELSLVQAENGRVRTIIEAFGGVPVKTYRLYEKSLEMRA